MPGSQQAPNGWFSRRHQTREEHDAARAAYAFRDNENKAPRPPCGKHHPGKCRVGAVSGCTA